MGFYVVHACFLFTIHKSCTCVRGDLHSPCAHRLTGQNSLRAPTQGCRPKRCRTCAACTLVHLCSTASTGVQEIQAERERLRAAAAGMAPADAEAARQAAEAPVMVVAENVRPSPFSWKPLLHSRCDAWYCSSSGTRPLRADHDPYWQAEDLRSCGRRCGCACCRTQTFDVQLI